MKKNSSLKSIRRSKIKIGIRRKISGTSDIPRLSVFRSNKGIYAQIINDLNSETLASATFKDKEIDATGTKAEVSKKVGLLLAEKAKKLNIDSVVFDRSGYLYHGSVKSLAEGAREGGLKF